MYMAVSGTDKGRRSCCSSLERSAIFGGDKHRKDGYASQA